MNAVAASSLLAPEAVVAEPVTVERSMLGGRVGVHLGTTRGGAAAARPMAERVLDRIEAWASRLTRFDDRSELCRLNAAHGSIVPVRPTLAAILDWSRSAEAVTDGFVNVAMLDERMAAELVHERPSPGPFASRAAARGWSMTRGPRTTLVHRPAGLHFDLDGVAKGWLADRALDRISGQRLSIVDLDGDVAIELAPGASFTIGIEDPDPNGRNLLVLRLDADLDERSTRFGIATSGVSKHRWRRAGQTTHHLIDPRTGRSATTDLVQATVIARTARHAEAFAKTAVILGSGDAEAMLGRSDILGAVLLTGDGRLLVTPGTTRFVA